MGGAFAHQILSVSYSRGGATHASQQRRFDQALKVQRQIVASCPNAAHRAKEFVPGSRAGGVQSQGLRVKRENSADTRDRRQKELHSLLDPPVDLRMRKCVAQAL